MYKSLFVWGTWMIRGDQESVEPAEECLYDILISIGYYGQILGNVDAKGWSALQFLRDIVYGHGKVSAKADLKG